MDRIGSRDPAGIKRAMKKYQVDNINDLVILLEHHKPQRKTMERLHNALGRLVGGFRYDPHEREFKKAFKYQFDNQDHINIRKRIREVKKQYDG